MKCQVSLYCSDLPETPGLQRSSCFTLFSTLDTGTENLIGFCYYPFQVLGTRVYVKQFICVDNCRLHSLLEWTFFLKEMWLYHLQRCLYLFSKVKLCLRKYIVNFAHFCKPLCTSLWCHLYDLLVMPIIWKSFLNCHVEKKYLKFCMM